MYSDTQGYKRARLAALRKSVLDRSVDLDLDLSRGLLFCRGAAAKHALRLGKTLAGSLCQPPIPDGSTHLRREALERVSLNRVDRKQVARVDNGKAARHCELESTTCTHTKELLVAALLHDLNQARPKLLNSRHMLREDTKVTRHSRDVDLRHLLVVVERLDQQQVPAFPLHTLCGSTKLRRSLSPTASA